MTAYDGSIEDTSMQPVFEIGLVCAVGSSGIVHESKVTNTGSPVIRLWQDNDLFK